MDITSKSFCVMPWTGLATDPTGGYKPCCWMDNTDVFRDKLENYESSEYLQRLKTQFLNGEYPDTCARCKWNDEQGLVSKRQRENQKYFKDKTFNNEQDYTVIDLRLSNKCNLKCATCSPKSSSSIYDEVKENIDTHQFSYLYVYKKVSKFNLTTPYDDVEIDGLIDRISPNARVYFTGGEPGLVKPAFRVLEMLLEKGYNKTVNLEFNSNFQALNTKWFDLLSNFKGLMMPSIDAVSEQAELIRYGCDWNTVDNNLREFINRCPDFKIMLFPTVSILNIFYLKDILVWADTLQAKHVEVNFTNRLSYPKYYNIANMPDELKQRATEYLKDIDHPHVQDIVKHLSASADEMSWNNFIKNMDKLDAIRNTDWRKVLEKLQ